MSVFSPSEGNPLTKEDILRRILARRVDGVWLDSTDFAILRLLSDYPGGRPVRNTMIQLFGEYEQYGLVTLHLAKFGPLGISSDEFFWAKITQEGLKLLGRHKDDK